MPKVFFRIFVQYQDSLKYNYIGAPKPFRCHKCQHQWFFDPFIDKGMLTVTCSKCEVSCNITDMFMEDFAEL